MEDLRVYKPVFQHLLDVVVYDRLEELVAKHTLPADRLEEFLDLRDAIVRGKASLDTVQDVLGSAFGLSVDAARAVAADFLGFVVLPLQKYLPEVVEVIASLGGDVSHYPAVIVEKEEVSPEDFLKKMVEKWGLNLPEHLLRRLVYLAKAYLTGARTKESVQHTLGRPIPVGGMELEPAVTERFFEALDAEREKFHLKPVAQVEEAVVPVGASVSGTALARAVDDPARVFSTNGSRTLVRRATSALTKTDALARMQALFSGGKTAVDAQDVVPEKPQAGMLGRSRQAAIDAFYSLFSKRPAETDDEAGGDLSWEELLELYQEPVQRKMLQPDAKVPEGIDEAVLDRLERIHVLFTQQGLSDVAFRDLTIGFLEEGRSKGKTRQLLEVVHGFSRADADSILALLLKEREKRGARFEEDLQVDLKAKKAVVAFDKPLVVPVAAPKEAIERVGVEHQSLELNEEEHREVAKQKRKIESKKTTGVDFQAASEVVVKDLQAVFSRYSFSEQQVSGFVHSVLRGTREVHQLVALLRDVHKVSPADLDVVHARLKKAVDELAVFSKESVPVPEVDDSGDSRVLDERFSAITKQKPSTSIGPVVSAKVSAARSKKEEVDLQSAAVSVADQQAAEMSRRPKKARAKVSAGSALPVQDRKKLTDVTYTKKLVGPVEELGTMTIADFRRLSSDPKEIVRKLFDKLVLLQATSYEDRIAGVTAWRKSPVNRLYLEMTREALQAGKSVAEIATSRRNDGKETLSPAEVQAVVEFNKMIKY